MSVFVLLLPIIFTGHAGCNWMVAFQTSCCIRASPKCSRGRSSLFISEAAFALVWRQHGLSQETEKENMPKTSLPDHASVLGLSEHFPLMCAGGQKLRCHGTKHRSKGVGLVPLRSNPFSSFMLGSPRRRRFNQNLTCALSRSELNPVPCKHPALETCQEYHHLQGILEPNHHDRPSGRRLLRGGSTTFFGDTDVVNFSISE